LVVAELLEMLRQLLVLLMLEHLAQFVEEIEKVHPAGTSLSHFAEELLNARKLPVLLSVVYQLPQIPHELVEPRLRHQQNLLIVLPSTCQFRVGDPRTFEDLLVTDIFFLDDFGQSLVEPLHHSVGLVERQPLGIPAVEIVLLTEDLADVAELVEKLALVGVFLYVDAIHEVNELEDVVSQSVNGLDFEPADEGFEADQHGKILLVLNVEHEVEVCLLLAGREGFLALHHQIAELVLYHFLDQHALHRLAALHLLHLPDGLLGSYSADRWKVPQLVEEDLLNQLLDLYVIELCLGFYIEEMVES
jgi:hypothetical protein